MSGLEDVSEIIIHLRINQLDCEKNPRQRSSDDGRQTIVCRFSPSGVGCHHFLDGLVPRSYVSIRQQILKGTTSFYCTQHAIDSLQMAIKYTQYMPEFHSQHTRMPNSQHYETNTLFFDHCTFTQFVFSVGEQINRQPAPSRDAADAKTNIKSTAHDSRRFIA